MAFACSNIVDMVADEPITVLELSLKAGCFRTERDAFRIITAGGFHINYNRVTEPDLQISRKHILPNNVTLIRTGKKTYHVIRWLQMKEVEKEKGNKSF